MTGQPMTKSLWHRMSHDLSKEPIHIYTQIITTQFVLLFFAIALFIFILVTLAISTLISQTSRFNYDNLHYINNETTDFFFQIKEDLHSITSNQDIRSAVVFSNQFENSSEFHFDRNTEEYLNYLLTRYVGYDLTLYNLKEAIQLSSAPHNTDIQGTTWYKKMMSDNLDELIITSNPEVSLEDKKVSYFIALKNYTETKNVGFIRIDFGYNVIEDLYNKKISPTYPIIILDSGDQIIFASESIPKDYVRQIAYENQFFVKEKQLAIGRHKYLVSKWTSDLTGWRLMSVIDIRKQLGPFTKLAYILIPVAVLIIILHTLISKSTSKRIIKPINDLNITMTNIRKGFLTPDELPSSDIQEIDNLVRNFEGLMCDVTQLIDKNQKSNLLQMESQFIALQQKINPHFLFNTLELISGQAIIEDAPYASEMAQRLGTLFRYNLRSPDILTLKEELTYLEDYIYIQQARFDFTLNIHINIDPRLMKEVIPKLTLQPLIENCIYHGFEDMPEEDNYIRIIGRVKEKTIQIVIEDNGIGLDPEDIERINYSLLEDTMNFQHFIHRKEHIGIRNVNARLCLLHHEKCCLQLLPTNQGLKIIITFPTCI